MHIIRAYALYNKETHFVIYLFIYVIEAKYVIKTCCYLFLMTVERPVIYVINQTK